MGTSEGYLRGRQYQPKEIARLCYKYGWRDKNLIIAVATCLSESDGWDQAYNLNRDDEGNILSKDCGLFQISIPADKVGSQYESDLFDAEKNVAMARRYFEGREWRPWYGYVNGHALNPDWWRWSDKYQEWRPGGRRIHKAIRGVANFWGEEFGIKSPDRTLVDFYSIPAKPDLPPQSS